MSNRACPECGFVNGVHRDNCRSQLAIVEQLYSKLITCPDCGEKCVSLEAHALVAHETHMRVAKEKAARISAEVQTIAIVAAGVAQAYNADNLTPEQIGARAVAIVRAIQNELATIKEPQS